MTTIGAGLRECWAVRPAAIGKNIADQDAVLEQEAPWNSTLRSWSAARPPPPRSPAHSLPTRCGGSGTGECIDHIRLALSEAVTNVLDHATTEENCEVRLTVRDGVCSVIVVDFGKGFDAASLASAMPDPSSPRGRGVAIMRLLDNVRFEPHPETGTVAYLTKRLEVEPGSPFDLLS